MNIKKFTELPKRSKFSIQKKNLFLVVVVIIDFNKIIVPERR